MRCPYCKSDNDRVIDSRTSADGFAIRRRRLCRECGRRYTTYERVEGTTLRVVKKSGERVEFDRSKITSGLLRACEKRPVTSEQLEQLVDWVERQCSEAFDKEVPSKVIGELIMEELRQLDQVAYVRFASVYRDFKDEGDLVHLADVPHDQSADELAGNLAIELVGDLVLDARDDLLQRVDGDRPFFAGPHQSGQDLAPLERLAGAVLLDHPDGRFLDPFVGGVAATAREAFAAAADGKSVGAGPGVDHAVVIRLAERALHGANLGQKPQDAGTQKR